MQSRCSGFLVFFLTFSLMALGQMPQEQPRNGGDFSNNTDPTKAVPKDTIIVKGAWFSATDPKVPVPEGGKVTSTEFTNDYFGFNLPLPQGWIEKHAPAPPSDTGGYVLAQLTPGPAYPKDKSRGVMMIAAQDMFFTLFPAKNARQLVNYSKNHLQQDYALELKPTETKIGGQPFVFYSYWAPKAGIHWYVLATEIRCHAVQIVMSSQDTKLLESMVLELNKMKLPAEANPTGGTGGGEAPVCIKDYAASDNVIERVDPVFTMRRFNPVPVRVIIDKEGKIKYIHFLSAFPEQEKAITDALKQWKLRPYEIDGKRVEVETGIMFGSAPRPVVASGADASTD